MGDILSHGPEPPRRRPPRWLAGASVVVLIAAVIAAVVVRTGGEDDRDGAQRVAESTEPAHTSLPSAGLPAPVPAAPTPTVRPGGTAAVILSQKAAFGFMLDRRDADASDGPWAVLVRSRKDGSLGRHGAVVTFPVHASHRGHRVTVSGAHGWAHENTVTWPIGGEYARVRGDLGERLLTRIAFQTRVVAGRPVVEAPPGYAVVAAEPYRSRHVREARYGPNELVAAGKVDGFVYTGCERGGAFEDRLYATEFRSAGQVHGHPAVLSTVGGGNATVAWEPSPGIVAYVGYSGVRLDDQVLAMMRELASRTIPLSAAQWKRLHPRHVESTNDYR